MAGEAVCNHIPKGQFLKWATQIAKTVRYMHEVGFIIHLDLHAYNWMVKANGNLCLIDFGCAKVLGKNGKIEAGLEAWYYDGISSPEMVERKEFSFGGDVWQLSVTFG